MPPEYVPGKCNIGRRGRAIRVTTGLVLIAISMVIGIAFVKPVSHLLSLALVFLFYVGILAILEGSMSFCVLHAARGTYDLNEPHGFASKKSDTMQKVGSEDWKKLDQRRALWIHLEALTGAVLLALLLALT
ncbi:MAG TPA: YgaP-like transmembrane domain [Candidatus Bathyarchaeia archaeon]|nr:YgaP-like transmembrane domain [Candidatus Dormibacteraeota bacterium]